MVWELPDLDTDSEAVMGRILDGIAARLPGWEPVEGAPEVAVAEEFGRELAATNALTIEVLQLAWAGLAGYFGLTPRLGARATLPDVELTATAEGGKVAISAGFSVVVGDLAFTLLEDTALSVTIDDLVPGTGVGDVPAQYLIHIAMDAADAGAITVDINDPATVVTATSNVASARIAAPAYGGADPESLTDFLGRFSDYMKAVRPGGVRAEDIAALARTVPGVWRAIAFDRSTDFAPQERTVTVVAIGPDGRPVTGGVLAALVSTLEATREVNFIFLQGFPAYETVRVDVEVTAAAGADPTAVQAGVLAAITAMLHPANWGSTPEDPRAWVDTYTLTPFDLAGRIFAVPGVVGITAITINGSPTGVTWAPPAFLFRRVDNPDDPTVITVNVS